MPSLFPDRGVVWGDEEDLSGAASEEVTFGRSWRFDYDAGDFVLTPSGKFAVTDAHEAWVQWCIKAVKTPRYRHMIYSRNYGSELEELIGQGDRRGVMESEIARMVSETLLADPRTESVDQFTFNWNMEQCVFSCRVGSVQEEMFILESEVI
ncbi:DUF2634 domain-containing protein [Paenibacillus tundrae]|uniref:DUF2634 domain-containing protein n=1 Tax=Paenibacillus tundrae TaxID=528187 RepID=A0ABT9WAH1_9BACL|nr:DUF2634 domain-containing protein [Paenibacillus tundrae]MDQ0170260.1 hypothetical protein [Paenibacillus tundrae]